MDEQADYTAVVISNADPTSEIGKTRDALEALEAQAKQMSEGVDEAVLSASEQFITLRGVIEDTRAVLKATASDYNAFMQQAIVRRGGNNTMGEIARHVSTMDHDMAKHATPGETSRVGARPHRVRMGVDGQPDGEARDVFAHENFKGMPAGTVDRIYNTLETVVLTALTQTSKDLVDRKGRATRLEHASMNRAAVASLDGKDDKAEGYLNVAAAARYSIEVIEKALPGVIEMEKNRAELDRLTQTLGKINDLMSNVRSLDAQKRDAESAGDFQTAGRFDSARVRELQRIPALSGEALKMAALANEKNVPVGFGGAVSGMQGLYQQEIAERGESQRRAAQQKIVDGYMGRLTGAKSAIDGAQADAEYAESGGNASEAREHRSRLKREIKKLGQVMRDTAGLENEVDPDMVPAEYGDLRKSLNGKRRGFGSRFAAEDRREAEEKERARVDALHGKALGENQKRDWGREDFAARMERGIGEAERRTVDLRDGTGTRAPDFSGLQDAVTKALRAGLINASEAQGYRGRMDGVERLQGIAGEKGEVNRDVNAFEKRVRSLMDGVDFHRANAQRFGPDGLNDAKEAAYHERAALRDSKELLSRIDQMNELMRRLVMSGQGEEAKRFRGTMSEAQIKGAAGYNDFRGAGENERPYMGGLGGWMRGEMHRMPGGRYASALFGDQLAGAVNGGGSRLLGQFAASAGGQAFARSTAGRAVMHGASKALGGAVAIEGGSAALTALATNPVTIAAAVAGVGAFMVNKYADGQLKRGGEARTEEIQAGDIARKAGLSGRILDDVRRADGNGGSGALRGEYAQLGYTSGQVLGYLGQTSIGGLSDAARQQTTLRGLTIARQKGLDSSEVASVQQELRRGMTVSDANAGRLDQDLSRFSLILTEAVKRGTGGPEMAASFRDAMAGASTLAGGKLSEATSAATLSQLLGVSRNEGPYMAGAQGVSAVGRMNQTVGGMAGADRMFFYNALRGKSAGELGYSGEQGAQVQAMLDENPMLATGFMLKNGTNETRQLMSERLVSASGGNMTQYSALLQGIGVDSNQADAEAADMSRYRRKNGSLEGWRSRALDTWSGRNGQAAPGEDAASMNDVQSKNENESIARRQETNLNEMKVRASHVSFDNVAGQIAIQSVQSVTLTGINVKKEIQTGLNDGPISRWWRGRHEGQNEKGYSSGGYTGGGGVGEVAGVVHGQEFVVNAAATRDNMALLHHLNSGGKVRGFSSGGPTSPASVPHGAGGDDNLAGAIRELTGVLRASPISGGTSGGVRNDLRANDGPGFLDSLYARGRAGLSRGWEGVRSAVGTAGSALQSAGSAVAGGVQALFGGSSGPQGDALASTAMNAIGDKDFVDIAGRCSQFVRQVTEKALGKADHALSGTLFGASAIETGNLWKKAGLTQTGAQVGGKYKAGDTLFQMSGSGGYGHVGIMGSDGMVYENSTRGKGGKMVTPIEKWGKVDLVGRLGGFGQPSAAQVRAAQGAGEGYGQQVVTRALGGGGAGGNIVHSGKLEVKVTGDGGVQFNTSLAQALSAVVGNKIGGAAVRAPQPGRARSGG